MLKSVKIVEVSGISIDIDVSRLVRRMVLTEGLLKAFILLSVTIIKYNVYCTHIDSPATESWKEHHNFADTSILGQVVESLLFK